MKYVRRQHFHNKLQYLVYVLVWNAQPYGHVFPCLTCFLTSLLSMTCMQVMVGLSDEVFDSIAAR